MFFLSSSLADTGDELIITGDIVNLRTGPSIDTDASIKLLQGRKVTEIQRRDDWVEIETHRDDIKTGWVHESLITTISTTATPEQNTSASPRFEHFLQSFNEHNEDTKRENGVIYFSAARDNGKGEGNIKVLATEAWINAEREEREETLSIVFKLWSNVVPDGSSISVLVFDKLGEQQMEMLR